MRALLSNAAQIRNVAKGAARNTQRSFEPLPFGPTFNVRFYGFDALGQDSVGPAADTLFRSRLHLTERRPAAERCEETVRRQSEYRQEYQ
jgi:hypothetical protein